MITSLIANDLVVNLTFLLKDLLMYVLAPIYIELPFLLLGVIHSTLLCVTLYVKRLNEKILLLVMVSSNKSRKDPMDHH